MDNYESKNLNSLLKKCIQEVLLYSVTLITPLNIIILTIALSQIEQKKINERIEYIAASIKPKIQLADEIEINASLKKIIETTDILGIISQSGEMNIAQFRPNYSDLNILEKENLVSISDFLFKKNIFRKMTFSTYPNNNSTFSVSVIFPNNIRYKILSYTLVITFTISLLIFLILFKSLDVVMSNISSPLKSLKLYIENFHGNSTADINLIKKIESLTETEAIREKFNQLQNANTVLNAQILDSETHKKISKLARQLSHDIRSPLAALKVVKEMGASGMEPDVAKLLTMSIDRITDIANTILPKNTVHGENKENAQSSFLWMLVDQIISEKRVEYKSSSDISIDFKTESSPFELNVLCNPTEFMRSISNMINNSIEAKDPLKKLNISVSLSRSHDYVLVTIQDNGKGMPPEVLTKAFDEGFTHGKTQGTGLGLYQVKKAIESWGGSIHIESQTNVGTTIIIKLKQSTQPQWLVNSIDVSNCKNIVVLDDEEYVFSILQDRFEPYVKLQYFKRIDDFEKNLPTFSDTLFFIDHDLKQDMSGIDLIQKHSLQVRSILLTGNYDDKQVQQRAAELGIKILPKPLINDLPITS